MGGFFSKMLGWGDSGSGDHGSRPSPARRGSGSPVRAARTGSSSSSEFAPLLTQSPRAAASSLSSSLSAVAQSSASSAKRKKKSRQAAKESMSPPVVPSPAASSPSRAAKSVPKASVGDDSGWTVVKSRKRGRKAKGSPPPGPPPGLSPRTRRWMNSPDTDGTRDVHGRGSSSAHTAAASAKAALKRGDLAGAHDQLDTAYRLRVAENRRNKSKNPSTDHGAGFVRARRDSVVRHIRATGRAPSPKSK